ncbi:hypothetical protein BGZ68_000241 [Mortierella alpina]|nr:hypothetical protein BGZ68_000241 [Mortierella alpina]
MAARFFLSIPDSVAVKDPYEEVFSLFTTETADAPWAHNRSVSQQASRLEVELDFTPAPSPAVSRPGSRPDSRTGSYFPSTTAASADYTDLPIDGETSEARPGSSLSLVDTSGMPASPLTPTGSRSPLSATAAAGAIESGMNNNNNTAKLKNPAARALMGSRKSSRTGAGSPVRVATPQPKKPVVIHQSLSTLSQPGQTGTVVWDSSILMAKFMLSIKGLSRTCYRRQARKSRTPSHQQQQQQSKARSVLQAQREQIRRLEEQAERLAVAEDGALTLRDDASIEQPHAAADNDTALDGDHNSRTQNNNTSKQIKDGENGEGDEVSADEMDTEDDDEDEDEELAGEEHLVFDPAETSILELGSGCGLLGIVMAELCQDLLLTDQKSVLPLLVKNLRKNLDKKYFDQDASSHSVLAAHTGISAGSGSTTAGSRRKKALEDSNGTSSNSSSNSTATKPCHIQVQELVWGQDLDQDLIRGFGMDFIVATDVVYNESIVPKLVQTLKELCEVRERVRQQLKDGQGDRFDKLQELLSTAVDARRDSASLRMRRMDKTVVLLAQELRTDYVHLSFLERLEKEGFRMVRMPKQLMDADYHSGYVVYALFLR